MILTDDLQDLALAYMEGLRCPRSVTIAIMLRYGEWDQFRLLETDPLLYCDAQSYIRAASAKAFLSKFDDADPGETEVREEATFQKWSWAEKQCFKTNRFFDKFLDFGRLASVQGSTEELLISLVRKNVEELIGRAPPSTFDGAFGPGATVSDRSGQTTVLHKMSSQPTFTPNALFHLVPWTGTAWARALGADSEMREPHVVRGNHYFTVPKTSWIYRACGKEPSINGYYQLGLGRILRRRLRSRGIDLDGNQEVHRQVACTGSLADHGSWSTIDLSSASDTVAYSVVKLLLPPAWFEALDALRSPFTQVQTGRGKRWYRLEKFSSMGNGYTFELETVIFTAIAMAMQVNPVPGHTLYCYGDDIIVPSDVANLTMRALEWFGFTVNWKKTFINGPFRESCGGDFYNGRAVRPYHLKEDPNEPQKLISLANGIRRMAMQNRHDPTLWPDLRRVWFRVLDCLPVDIRSCRGPEELGDLCIHDDESRWRTRWRTNGIRYVRVYRPAKFRGVSLGRFDSTTLMAGALYGVAPRNPPRTTGRHGGAITHDHKWDMRRTLDLRDGVEGYKVGWAPYS